MPAMGQSLRSRPPFYILARCAITLNATARYSADLFRDAVDTDLEIQPQFNVCAEVGLDDVSDVLGMIYMNCQPTRATQIKLLSNTLSKAQV